MNKQMTISMKQTDYGLRCFFNGPIDDPDAYWTGLVTVDGNDVIVAKSCIKHKAEWAFKPSIFLKAKIAKALLIYLKPKYGTRFNITIRE